MPVSRKRPAQDRDSDVESSDSSSPRFAATISSHRRPNLPAEASRDSDVSNAYDSPPGETQAISGTDLMIKKLVRLALASEYSRQVIRRNDISLKVLGEHGSRQFKPVFDGAQRALKSRFGMLMVEQPLKEKLTISQRRAAQRTERQSTTSKSWTVVSVLPPAYRIPAILPPSKASSSVTESSYVAIYTFIISVIMLSGGSLPEQKLERYLRRVNAENYTPIDRTDRILARLCREGYLLRNRDVDGGEEVVEYLVGPRGKVEVGVKGVAGLAREVYGIGKAGDETNGGDAEIEDFEKRLQRSLGICENVRDMDDDDGQSGEPHGDGNAGEQNRDSGRNRRSRRLRIAEDDSYLDE